MTDYISREAAQKIAMALAADFDMGEDFECEATRRINGIPAADVAPVVHGCWELHKPTEEEQIESLKYIGSPVTEPRWECSECGMIEDGIYPYCHCGALMDLKEERHET